jgi:hypothetical protein
MLSHATTDDDEHRGLIIAALALGAKVKDHSARKHHVALIYFNDDEAEADAYDKLCDSGYAILQGKV